MEFHVYILYSKIRDKYYVGFTSDSLGERLRRHNSNHKGFTGEVGDWEVVYYELHNDKRCAIQREKEIKSWRSRKRIEALIQTGK